MFDSARAAVVRPPLSGVNAPIGPAQLGLAPTEVARVVQVTGQLVRDLQTGLMRREDCVCYHGSPIREVEPCLRWLAAESPLRKSVGELLQWGGEEVPKARYTYHQLREAAWAVYETASRAIPPAELALLTGGMVGHSEAVVIPEGFPSPDEVHRAYRDFSEPLRALLEGIAVRLIAEPQGSRYRGSDLDRNPFYLRSAVISCLAETLPTIEAYREARREAPLEKIPPPDPALEAILRHWEEIIDWLGQTSPLFQNNFFDYCNNRSFLQGREVRDFQNPLDILNRVRGRDFVVSEQSTMPKTPSVRSRPRSIFFVREAEPEPLFRELFYRVASHAETRGFIATAAGLSEAVLLTERHFRPGLARALARLASPASPTPEADDPMIGRQLGAAAALLDLFIGSPHAMEQGRFFLTELPAAGLGFEAQRVLVARINRTLGRRYEIYHHGMTRRLRLAKPDTPKPSNPFGTLPTELQGEMTQLAKPLAGRPETIRFAGKTLSEDGDWFRYVAIRWFDRTLKFLHPTVEALRSDPDAEASAKVEKKVQCLFAVLDWLATQPIPYQHYFLRRVMEQAWSRRRGYPFLGLCLEVLDRRFEASYLLAVKHDKHNTEPLYHICEIPADTRLQGEFARLVLDPRLRERIIRASGLPPNLLLTDEKLAEGLTTAVVTLHARRDETSGQLPLGDLMALAAILQLFVVKGPLLPQMEFFGRRLVTAGLSPEVQQRLVAEINEALGLDFRLDYRRREPDAPWRRWTLTAGPRVGGFRWTDYLFKLGEMLFLPGIGVVRVDSIDRGMTVGDADFFYGLCCLTGCRSIMIPIPRAQGRGLRPLSPPGLIPRAYEVLGQPAGGLGMESAPYLKRLQGGDLLELAALVRDLFWLKRRYRTDGDSTRSKAFPVWLVPYFDRALQQLAEEVATVQGRGVEDVQQGVIGKLRATQSSPPPPQVAATPRQSDALSPVAPPEDSALARRVRSLTVPAGSWSHLAVGETYLLYDVDGTYSHSILWDKITREIVALAEHVIPAGTRFIFRGLPIAGFRLADVAKLLRELLGGIKVPSLDLILQTRTGDVVRFVKNGTRSHAINFQRDPSAIADADFHWLEELKKLLREVKTPGFTYG